MGTWVKAPVSARVWVKLQSLQEKIDEKPFAQCLAYNSISINVASFFPSPSCFLCCPHLWVWPSELGTLTYKPVCIWKVDEESWRGKNVIAIAGALPGDQQLQRPYLLRRGAAWKLFMRFQKQQGHQFYSHPASFVNTAFEWEWLGSLTRTRLILASLEQGTIKILCSPRLRGLLSNLRLSTNNNSSMVPSENLISQSSPRVGLRQVIWFVRSQAWQHVFTIMLIFQPAASVWRKACGRRVGCDQVKAEEEGCVLGSLRVFLSIETSSSRGTWASFSNCSLDHGFDCSWIFTRQGPGNMLHLASCQGRLWLQLAMGTGSPSLWVSFLWAMRLGGRDNMCVSVCEDGGKVWPVEAGRCRDIFHEWMKFSFMGTIPHT